MMCALGLLNRDVGPENRCSFKTVWMLTVRSSPSCLPINRSPLAACGDANGRQAREDCLPALHSVLGRHRVCESLLSLALTRPQSQRAVAEQVEDDQAQGPEA